MAWRSKKKVMSETKSSNGALVQVEGVEKVFHRGSEDIHVLANLSLQVPSGEFLALMGRRVRARARC